MIRTPGAATSTSEPKLLSVERVLSRPMGVDLSLPPVQPSESTSAETLVTSLYVAGIALLASVEPLPAAATTLTSAETGL